LLLKAGFPTSDERRRNRAGAVNRFKRAILQAPMRFYVGIEGGVSQRPTG
jgi:non-canonical (house-cleaning) NTP pyrophosphatase